MFKHTRLLAACLIVLLSSLPARAQDSTDHQYLENRLANDAALNSSRSEMEELGTDRAATSDRMGEMQGSLADLEAEMVRLAQQVAAQEAYVADVAARRQLASDRHIAASAALQQANEALARQQALATERLVHLYIFAAEHSTTLLLHAADVTEMEARQVVLTTIGEHDKQLLETLDAIAVDVAARREAVAELGRNIDDLAAEADAALAALHGTQTRQAAVHAQISEQITGLHAEVVALEAAQEVVEAILNRRRGEIRLEAAERDRLRRICYDNPRSPLDSNGAWVDCPSVGVVIPPAAVRWPLVDRVTSEYGQRWGRMHQGIDIAGDFGDTIVAAESGRVDHVGHIGGYGTTVIIDHGGGMSTLYGHMQSSAVSPGATVSQGQVVGYAGNSGFSTGPHLHFEIRIDGVHVNPRRYLP